MLIAPHWAISASVAGCDQRVFEWGVAKQKALSLKSGGDVAPQ
jgi:hypothetical protein